MSMSRTIAGLAVSMAALIFVSQASATVTFLDTWNLTGPSGSAPTTLNNSVAGSPSLSRVGSPMMSGTGTNFANSGGDTTITANNYYSNRTADTGLTSADAGNWGVDAIVTMNALPPCNAGNYGQQTVLYLGDGSTNTLVGTAPQHTDFSLETLDASDSNGATTPSSNDQVAWAVALYGATVNISTPGQGGAVVVGKKVHIAAVFEGGTLHMYVNQVQVPFTTYGGSSENGLPQSGTEIGASNSNTPSQFVSGLDGTVSLARVFTFQSGNFHISDLAVASPEPTSLALLGLGGLGLLIRRRRVC